MSSPQSVPPSSNTGAQITAPVENRCIIDWFAFTIKKSDPYEVTDMMGLKRGLFSELERGGMGYKKRLQFGHITIYFDGTDNMGVHVEMSGQGCREFETSSHTWLDLIALIELEKGGITRLDIAIDTVDGSLPLSNITAALDAGNVRTRFSKTRVIEAADISVDGLSNKSETRYFGSVSSRCMFRLYDKSAQLGLDSDWIRFELQLRDDRAQAAASQILLRHDLGFVATGIINQYLAFINDDDSNRSRCSLQDWWFSWLQHTDKLKISTAKAIRLINDVKDFLKKQYSPTFAMIKKAVGISEFSDFMHSLVSEGYSRMKQKHENIIMNSRFCSDLPF